MVHVSSFTYVFLQTNSIRNKKLNIQPQTVKQPCRSLKRVANVWQAHTEEREPELDLILEALAQGRRLRASDITVHGPRFSVIFLLSQKRKVTWKFLKIRSRF